MIFLVHVNKILRKHHTDIQRTGFAQSFKLSSLDFYTATFILNRKVHLLINPPEAVSNYIKQILDAKSV